MWLGQAIENIPDWNLQRQTLLNDMLCGDYHVLWKFGHSVMICIVIPVPLIVEPATVRPTRAILTRSLAPQRQSDPLLPMPLLRVVVRWGYIFPPSGVTCATGVSFIPIRQLSP